MRPSTPDLQYTTRIAQAANHAEAQTSLIPNGNLLCDEALLLAAPLAVAFELPEDAAIDGWVLDVPVFVYAVFDVEFVVISALLVGIMVGIVERFGYEVWV